MKNNFLQCRHMFIASIGTHSVVTMYEMDGKKIKILPSTQGSPFALAVHPTKSLLYWADPREGMIIYENYTTSRSAQLLKMLIDGVMSLAVSEEDIYYTAKKRQLNILKGHSTFVLQLLGEENPSVPRRVTYSPAATPGLSPAWSCLNGNGGCSYICLTSSSGKTCACSSHSILSSDNVTCVAKPCNATDFKCTNGQCLKGEKKCDGFTNCEDGSDEIDCSRCPYDDFECKNGRCILKSWQCDNRNDCGDNSDEIDCLTPTANCTKDQAKCVNGECFPLFWRCDGETDCPDGSDESNCNETVCIDNWVRCDNGQCLPELWTCDGTGDCSDKSDEKNCSKLKTCKIHEFRCESDGSCLDKVLRCNGIAECNDQSDEHNCSQSHKECKTGMFQCEDDTCIYDYEVCDGHKDCSQNEDETNCTHAVCKPEEILCPESKRCISIKWICDGDMDCSDGSDEKCFTTENCDGFYCYLNGQCLSWSKVCDGRSDCLNSTDESGFCSRSCGLDNGGYSQICKKTPKGCKCICNEGFRLLHYNKACDDINECLSPGICSHFCENTMGSYKCKCADGYFLQTDHRYCKAKGGPAVLTYLLVDQLCILDLLLNSTRCYSFGTDLRSMDYDAADGTFYCAELNDGSINRISTKNLTKEVIFIPSTTPRGLKYDWIAKNLYLLYENSSIGVCKRDGNFCKILLTSKERRMDSLVIAPTHGFMFWTVWASHVRHQHSGLIERAEMDGSHRVTIISEYTEFPTAITVDHALQMIYWSDHLPTLECANFHGFQRRTIIHSDAYRPYAVAVFEDDVFWSDRRSGGIIKCNKYIKGHCEKISDKNSMVLDLLVAHYVMQPKVTNPCQNSKCEHMCVLTRTSYVCMGDEERYGGTTTHLQTVPPVSEGKQCSKNDFQCSDEQCISDDLICDGNIDCNDGSDEQDCEK